MKDLKFILEELKKHRERLIFSKEKIESWKDLSAETLKNPEKVETIDSFIFRFSKLQDSMGQKLFPATLEFLGEDIRGLPFIDILNKLEKLRLIDSAGKWKELRELRNLLTHTYPWEEEELISNIKVALKRSEELLETLERFENYLRERGLEFED